MATLKRQKPNGEWEYIQVVGSDTISAFDAHLADNTKQIPHIGTTTNVGNAFSATTAETIGANQKFTVKFNTASTGAPTLAVSTIASSAAKAIKKPGGNDASVKAGVYTVFWDGTNFQLLCEGGEERQGDNVALASSVSGTTLKLTAPGGEYDGIDDTVTITDADFVAANIKNGVNIFGIVGNLTSLKYASGTATSSNSTLSFTYTGGSTSWYFLTINSLTFVPKIIILRCYPQSELVFYQYNTPLSSADPAILIFALRINGPTIQFALTGNAYVDSSGFRFPVNYNSQSYAWEAISW